MSTPDNLVSLISEMGNQVGCEPRPITPLPGLTLNAIEGLKATFPGTLSRDLQDLLEHTCGLEGTALGSLDFTGQWHGEEPLAVFRPCLTLAIDGEGRRWIAEGATDGRLPGPVWCILSNPQVALYVDDDLAGFLSELQGRTSSGDMDGWLKALSLEARVVWKHRASWGLRASGMSDPAIRNWMATLPPDAYVYDLRAPALVRGWPYGVAGPAGRYYRCGRSPVFAVSGPPSADRCLQDLSEMASSFPFGQPAAPLAALAITPPNRQTRTPVDPKELRRCA